MSDKFPSDIRQVDYNPNAKNNVLCFRHYNANEEVHGKPMHEWLRFSVCYWHTFRGTGADPFGFPTLDRPWEDGTDSIENAKRRMRVAFDFMNRLGVKYWTFHDRDIAPAGSSLEEANKNLDELVELAEELQEKYGIKLLWNTCNLFAHPRYAHGAATSPNCHVLAYAAAQVKKGLEVGKRLGAQNFVFWGGREGYSTLLNTKLKTELDNMAKFFKMVVAYKKKIGFEGQLLLEPKPKEPCKHQYDYDAQTVMCFLHTYGLQNDFKLNIEPNHTTLAGHSHEHDIAISSAYNMLGSIDSNTGSPDLGWDTDQFPMDLKNATKIMIVVLKQGGIAPGGLNFDCKVRRESTSPEDLLIAHIGAMDCFAKALKCASKFINDDPFKDLMSSRYHNWYSKVAEKLEKGECTLEDCEEHVKLHGEPRVFSGKQEKFESIFNRYLM